MINKLNELKQKMDEAKSKLDNVIVTGSAGDGAVTVEMTANRTIKKIEIEDAMCLPERKEELIDYLELAFSKALEEAQNISEKEMMASGKGMLPNIPGLF
ncbi:MAG: YbaB/EbfC family nucleoid-associated protein [Bacteroidia bacterium]